MSHYFTTPSDLERRRPIEVRFWETDWEFTTANGVFSHDGLDLGTGVLLRTHTPAPSSRRLLDLGCGWGVLAVALATACPEALVDAVDTNERALALTRLNADAHGVAERVRALTPDAVADDVRYDEIWSNPPIRIGKEALHDLLTTWLAKLTPDGVARLVVGRNLGADSLQRWLADAGWEVERTASAKGFRVFDITPTGEQGSGYQSSSSGGSPRTVGAPGAVEPHPDHPGGAHGYRRQDREQGRGVGRQGQGRGR